MMHTTKTLGYSITTDPNFFDKENKIAPELSKKIEQYHRLALEGKKSSVQKILAAIEKYPENPQLKNYLTCLYGELGDYEKMYAANRWIVAEHPDYLFGKLNLANEYYLKKEYEKMPEILGESMELKALYPNREVFHLAEVMSFFKTAVLYYTAIGNIEQAEIRCNIMNEIDPVSKETEFAFQHLMGARLEAGLKRHEEEEKNKITVKTKDQKATNITQAPTFINKEIGWLYTNGLKIKRDKLDTLLKLPKESLIPDLILVLEDSINRYNHFSNLVDSDGWVEEKMNFPVHAIFLLGELKAAESMETIFRVLSQSDEYLDLYFGDFLTSGLWEPVYKIVNSFPDECKRFMYQPAINTYSKTVISDIFEQVALHQPKRKSEVILWFRDIINFFLNSSPEKNIIDSDLISFIICSILDFDGKELLPEIQILFEKGLVSKSVCGDFEEVKKDLLVKHTENTTKDLLPVAERYQEITSTWAGYNKDKNNTGSASSYDNYRERENLYVPTGPKIGRNDPCPCGSGKKYKKCCMN